MRSGWIKKVADKVEMSYVGNALAMILKCVLETEPQGIELQPQLQRLAPPLLLLTLEGMAQLFPIVRMILWSSLVPQNQREVLVITTPMMMMMAVFLSQLTFLRELHQLHLTFMLVLVGRVVRGNLLIGLSLVQITLETLVLIMFGGRVWMVSWRDSISGPSDRA
jgi:hypothetical protein